jgi:hypothetical protein
MFRMEAYNKCLKWRLPAFVFKAILPDNGGSKHL